jgi:hypothetical protein
MARRSVLQTVVAVAIAFGLGVAFGHVVWR